MNQVSLARDETADVLLDRYGNMILRLAYSCMKNIPDAEDVLQDVLVKILEKAPVFESEEHRKAWLIRVTVNICRSRLRSPWRRHKELEETDAAAATENGAQVLYKSGGADSLRPGQQQDHQSAQS